MENKEEMLNRRAVYNEKLIGEDNDIDTVGVCANCGIEFHIHKK